MSEYRDFSIDQGRQPWLAELQQFEDAAAVILATSRTVPGYLDQPEYNAPHLTRAEALQQQLSAVSDRFIAGTLDAQALLTLFQGAYAAFPNHEDSIAGKLTVASLYNQFFDLSNPQSPISPSYEDLVLDAQLYGRANKTLIRHAGRGAFATLPPGAPIGMQVALLTPEGALNGLQLKTGPNMFVNFVLGHLDAQPYDDSGSRLTYVELLVNPAQS